ncbi:hypothetical protein [Nocardia stercoris]|uniref:Uncharacterized protein n=1 Tax=Nocardia stercoris TaxID=2483361 RepID=A0A3M2LBW3_9NOCA|nr:hypothetical protein [Nocardia stercoris]RMI32168.1 hypothetical protein EBN03_14260 [Nocardia stercoris]
MANERRDGQEPTVGEVLDFWIERPDTASALGPSGAELIADHLAALHRRFGPMPLSQLTPTRVLAEYSGPAHTDLDDLTAGAERALLGLAVDIAVAAGFIDSSPLRAGGGGDQLARRPAEAS